MRISDWSSDVCSSDLSGWGVNLAYTFTDAEENRPNASKNETFLFDYPFARGDYFVSTGVPEHRFVLSVIYSPGWDLTFSGKLILESPTPIARTNRLLSPTNGDRKSAVLGKRVSVRVNLGGRSIIKQKNQQHTK